VSQNEIMQLAWVAVAAVVAPLVALRLRRLAIPGVVLELVFGMLLGPSVLDWVDPIGLIADFSNFGLALLMFLAGFEIDLQRMRGRPLALAATTWCGSLVIGLAAAIVLFLGGHRHGELIIGLTLVTTALGTLLPIVRDGGVLDTPLGPHILAVGTIAEFGPIVLVALLLGGHHPVGTALLLLGFGVVAMGFAVAASRPWGRAFAGWLRAGLHASSQLPVRFSMLPSSC
jgi:Kef-type K+ transport system membrane component KefB